MFLWCIRLLNTAPSFMEEPKTCNSCKIEYLKLKKCCLKKPTFFSQGVINEEVANIAWVPSSFMAGLQIQMEVSVCSKGAVGSKACRREALHCGLSTLGAPKHWWLGALPQLLFCFFILVLSHSHLLLPSFWLRAGWDGALAQPWQVWSHFLGCCLLTASRKKRLIKVLCSWLLCEVLFSTLMCPPECKVMPILLKAVIVWNWGELLRNDFQLDSLVMELKKKFNSQVK